jgi:Transglycosylase SLT domain
MVDGEAAANRLPASFLARILWQESRLRIEATSPAGAEGVAQFMPRTAAEHGLADPREPAPAIAAAARLLADLKIQFGNLGLAAAAYNAGTGRVMKWLRRQSDLPAETRLYVAAVTGRPVEEWSLPLGTQTSGGGDEPCLAVTPDLARSVPTRTASPDWALRLDRDLSRAFGVVAAPPPHRRDLGLESLRAGFALCDRIRLLGARCAVYQR